MSRRALTPAVLVAVFVVGACSSSSEDAGTCSQLQSEARSALEPAESEVSCTVDSDCVSANNSTSCWQACGAFVSQGGAAALSSAVAHQNATTCATFLSDGCKPNGALPCAFVGPPTCVAGRCQGSDAAEVADAGVDSSSDAP